MSDLIWVGNTLYPRWLVFGGPLLTFVIVVLAFICAAIEEHRKP